jgi:hypothetical protein
MKNFTNLHRDKFDDEILSRLDKGLIDSLKIEYEIFI